MRKDVEVAVEDSAKAQEAARGGREEAGVAVSAPGPGACASVRLAEKRRRISREFPASI